MNVCKSVGGFMKQGKLFAVAAAVITIAGCAKRADSVVPVSIPIAAYSGFECPELTQEYLREYNQLNHLARAQNQAATGDAIGVFLLGVPTASVTGHDKEGDLAVAKGKVLSIESALKSKSCDVPPPPAPPPPKSEPAHVAASE